MMTLVLIEDNRDDAELALDALRTSGLENTLMHFRNCETAQVWLNTYEDRVPLMLLDLAFPGHMSGLDFLRWMRAHTTFRTIPVIVLTGYPEDRVQAYGLGVSGFIEKPVNKYQLLDAIQGIGLRWRITV